jgi:hypothetical protein
MRASTAFFAGAGTVVTVVAAGLGGGLLIADTMNPKAQQATKLERRAAPAPSPAPSSSPSPQAQSAATTATNVPAAKPDAKPDASEPAAVPSPSSQPVQRDVQDRSTAPDAAFAKARDAELKTSDADGKRGADKRHTRRHQQWVERPRLQRQPEPDRRDVEQAARDEGDAGNYRDDSAPRGYRDDRGARNYRDDRSRRGYADGSGRAYQDGRVRGDLAEPVELELPRVRLFDGF